MNWIKINKYNITLLFFGVLAGLFIAEIFFRVAVPEPILSDPFLGSRYRPGLGRDDNGFKNKKVLERADIVAIGDSQTEGNNATINEAWPQVLGELSGKSVYQMAMGGYSPVQYSYLLDQALKLEPKIIIAGFYAGNDLLEAQGIVYQNENWLHLRDPNFVPISVEDSNPDVRLVFQSGLSADSFSLKFLKFRNWLRSQSKLYTFLGRSTRAFREQFDLAETKEEKIKRITEWAQNNPGTAIAYNEENIETLLSPTYRLDTVDLNNSYAQEGWRISKSLLKEMKEKVKSSNKKFILIYIPTKEYAYAQSGKLSDVDEMRFYEAKEDNLKKHFFDFCVVESIVCHDVTQSMAEALKSGKTIYPHTTDGHPIAAGYTVIAESIQDFLNGHNIK